MECFAQQVRRLLGALLLGGVSMQRIVTARGNTLDWPYLELPPANKKHISTRAYKCDRILRLSSDADSMHNYLGSPLSLRDL